MFRFLSLAVLMALLSSFTNADEGIYLLGPGDLISISVYDEPDLSLKELRIGLSGHRKK